MKDINKTKAQLVGELEEMRQRVAVLEARDAQRGGAEPALSDSEEKLHAIFQSISDAVSVVDLQGNIIEANEAAARLGGYRSRKEIIGQNGFDFIAESDRARAMESFERLLKDGYTPPTEFKFKDKDGVELDAEVAASVLRDRTGEIVGFVDVLRDVRERKRVEEQLRQSEERYSDLLDRVNDVVFSVDGIGTITTINQAVRQWGYEPEELIGTNFIELIPPDWMLYISPSFESFAGYTPGEVEGRNFAEFIHEEDLPRLIENYRSVLDGNVKANEYRMKTKSGELRWMRTSSKPVYVKGRVFGVHGVLMDITERRQAEDRLRESEEKLRLMFESITDGVTVTDLKGTFVDANDAAVHMFGCKSREELIGRNGIDFVAEQDREKATKVMRRAYKKGRAKDIQHKLVRKSGLEFDSEWSVSLMRDGEGKPVGFIYIFKDITERKGLEKEIRDSEERMRIMFESVPDGMLVCDLEGKIERFNEAALRMSGYRSEDVIGKTVMDFMLPEEREKAVRELQQTLAVGIDSRPIEYTLLGANGKEIEAELSAAVMKDSEGNPVGIVGTARDISERKRMEDELRQSEEKLRGIFDSIRDGIVLTDLELNVLEANDAVVRMAGLDTREELIGQNALDFLMPEDRGKAAAPLPEAVEGRPVEAGEYRVRSVRGEEFDARAGITTLHDSEGNLSGFVAVVQDVTEQRRRGGGRRRGFRFQRHQHRRREDIEAQEEKRCRQEHP